MAHWLSSFHNLIPKICFAGMDSTVLNKSTRITSQVLRMSDVRFAEPMDTAIGIDISISQMEIKKSGN